MLKHAAFILALSLAAAAPAAAQQLAPKNDRVPPGMQPPPGMCRIWLEGVPPGQQPAPTDCPTAVRNRPPNGRVIFGDDYVDRGKGNKPNDDRDDRRRGKPKKPADDHRNR
jgi:hypothetical protein